MEHFHLRIFLQVPLLLVVREIASDLLFHAIAAHGATVGFDKEVSDVAPLQAERVLEGELEIRPHGQRRLLAIPVKAGRVVPERRAVVLAVDNLNSTLTLLAD